MNKLINLAILSLVLTIGAFAQNDVSTNTPVALDNGETSIGVQFTRSNPNVVKPSFKFDNVTDTVGVNVSFTSYETKVIGLTAEASANFSPGTKSVQSYTALGGITLKARRGMTVQPFIKGLAGLAIVNADNEKGFTSNLDVGLAFKATTGLDIGRNRVKWRMLEVGYLQTNLYGQRQHNFVASTGIVF